MKIQHWVCIFLFSSLCGCSTVSAVSTIASSISPISKGGLSAELQVGDKTTQVKATGKSESITLEAKVEKVQAKKATVDQSTKKEDKKTEIGEIKGNVQVTQGPSAGTLVFLGSGWPLFLLFSMYLLLRKRTA